VEWQELGLDYSNDLRARRNRLLRVYAIHKTCSRRDGVTNHRNPDSVLPVATKSTKTLQKKQTAAGSSIE